MRSQNSPFERRLRLLIAQEFAARGYYLDAEGFFDRVPFSELNNEELALLARIALAGGNKSLAMVRFDEWSRREPSNAEAQSGLAEAQTLSGLPSLRAKMAEFMGSLRHFFQTHWARGPTSDKRNL